MATHAIAVSTPRPLNFGYYAQIFRKETKYEFVKMLRTKTFSLSVLGFPVMFLTGGLLLITQAAKAYGNPFFRAKLIFLLLLGINAVVYQKLFFPKMAEWDSAGGAPAGAKFCAAFSLVIWIGVIVCGRTMAYQF